MDKKILNISANTIFPQIKCSFLLKTNTHISNIYSSARRILTWKFLSEQLKTVLGLAPSNNLSVMTASLRITFSG